MLRIDKLAVLPALVLLAACGDEPDEAPAVQTPTTAGAQGEVLGGTISDEMLPLDTLQSQSPPLAPEPDESGDSKADEDETGAAETAAEATVAEADAEE